MKLYKNEEQVVERLEEILTKEKRTGKHIVLEEPDADYNFLFWGDNEKNIIVEENIIDDILENLSQGLSISKSLERFLDDILDNIEDCEQTLEFENEEKYHSWVADIEFKNGEEKTFSQWCVVAYDILYGNWAHGANEAIKYGFFSASDCMTAFDDWRNRYGEENDILPLESIPYLVENINQIKYDKLWDKIQKEYIKKTDCK